jgi:hypothetical protein
MNALQLFKNYKHYALEDNLSFNKLDNRITDFKKILKSQNEKKVSPLLISNLLKEFNDHWSQKKDFTQIPDRIIRRVNLIICFEELHNKLLYDHSFCTQLFTYIEKNKKHILAKKVFNELLKDYDVNCNYLFNYLENLTVIMSSSRKKSIVRLMDKIEKYSLTSKSAPDSIAKLLMYNLPEVETVKEELGLYGEFAGRGLGLLVIEKFSKHVQLRLETEEYTILDVYLSFIVQDNELVATQIKTAVFHTLLKPFLSKDPPEYVKNIILNVCNLLGDPRAKSEKWYSIDLDAKRVVLRWKVGLTLKAFFAIIKYAAKTESSADRMWKYREIFWNAYLDEKEIVEAWVLLGSVARANKKSFLDDAIDHGFLGTGVQTNHNAILMKIGGLTLCEWSHSGRIRIWSEGNPQAPELYQEVYHKHELTEGADFETNHTGADRSTWQDKVHEVIRRKTNIVVSKDKYFKND